MSASWFLSDPIVALQLPTGLKILTLCPLDKWNLHESTRLLDFPYGLEFYEPCPFFSNGPSSLVMLSNVEQLEC